MTYAKIYSQLAESSVAEHELHVRWMWIVFLIKCDRDGKVYGTVGALARMANLTIQQTEQALHVLTSPDPDSTTPDDEGRRVLKLDGNEWYVVNYIKYRDYKDPDKIRAQTAERVRRHRANKKGNGETQNVTPSVSGSGSGLDSDMSLEDQTLVNDEDAADLSGSEDARTIANENQAYAKEKGDRWNSMAADLGMTRIQRVGPKRRTSILARRKEYGDEAVDKVIDAPRGSSFLRGETGRDSWVGATFDWIFKPSNFVKILEGNYDDRAVPRVDPSAPDFSEYNIAAGFALDAK